MGNRSKFGKKKLNLEDIFSWIAAMAVAAILFIAVSIERLI